LALLQVNTAFIRAGRVSYPRESPEASVIELPIVDYSPFSAILATLYSFSLLSQLSIPSLHFLSKSLHSLFVCPTNVFSFIVCLFLKPLLCCAMYVNCNRTMSSSFLLDMGQKQREVYWFHGRRKMGNQNPTLTASTRIFSR